MREQFLRKTVGLNYTIVLVVNEHTFLNACYNTQSTKNFSVLTVVNTQTTFLKTFNISKNTFSSNFCKHTDYIKNAQSTKKLSDLTVVNRQTTKKTFNCCKHTQTPFLKTFSISKTYNCCKHTDHISKAFRSDCCKQTEYNSNFKGFH
jgi:hypothetical protein